MCSRFGASAREFPCFNAKTCKNRMGQETEKSETLGFRVWGVGFRA